MRNLLTVVMSLALISCVSHQEYPSDWVSIETANNDGCPNLVGTYSNSGLSNSNHYVPTLADILIPAFRGAADAIEINESIDSLLIAVIESGEKKSELALSRNSEAVYCKGGSLIVEKGKVVNREGAIGKEWDTFIIQKNEQGLIVNRHHGAVGVLFVIPIAGKESHWFLYKKT